MKQQKKQNRGMSPAAAAVLQAGLSAAVNAVAGQLMAGDKVTYRRSYYDPGHWPKECPATVLAVGADGAHTLRVHACEDEPDAQTLRVGIAEHDGGQTEAATWTRAE